MHTALLFAVLAAATGGAPGDSLAPPHAAVLRAAPAPDHLRIDGRLDEAAWAAAPVAERFTQHDPDEGRPASERTEVRVLIGDEAVTIGARLYDREPRAIRRRLVRRDDDLASDRLSVYLDPEGDHLSAYRFDVSPAGAYRDAALDAQMSHDFSWDPVWRAAASVDSLGWSVEMEIPLSQLRYHAGDERAWGLQLERWIDRRQELDQFAFVPKKEHADVSRFGRLEGLGALHGQRHLELLPYALGRVRNELVAPGDPFHDAFDRDVSVGGDLKYRLGGSLTLDATVHPDFGQVEVDPAVVNLTAVETFFPEKRPFFVERADLFQFGVTQSNNLFGTPTVFHARRIGRVPQRGIDDPAFAFVDVPPITDIAGAVKLTGKTAGGWSIAALDAVTPEERARARDTTGAGHRVPVEPLTNYSVLRVQRALRGGGTTVGAIATGVARDRGDATLAQLLRSHAYVGGVDFTHYWAGRNWAMDGFLMGSRVQGSADAIAATQRATAHYFQRPDAPHLTYDPARTRLDGEASLLSVQKIGGEHWGMSMTYQDMSPGFESNDLGYIGSVDLRGFSTFLLYKQNTPSKLLRNWDWSVFSNDCWNWGGDVTYQGYETMGGATFANYWAFNGRASWFPQAYDDRLTRGGPVAGIPPGGRVAGTLTTDSRRTWQLRTNVNASWNDVGAHALTVSPTLTLHPSTSLLLRLTPSFVRSRDMAQYVTTVADPTATATYGARYVFATIDQRVLSLDTRVDWTFSPALSFQLYLQPFVATGLYRSLKQLHAPRTNAYDVYGAHAGTIARVDGGWEVDPDGAGPAASFAVPDPDFNFRSLLGNAVLRWQYRPGSTLFLVWQQSRAGAEGFGDFRFGRDFSALFDRRPENTVALKATWWIGL